MANLNKVLLLGRLTRDPEIRTFANGGKVASFGFAVSNRKKNQSTGQYEDVPVFVDVDAFNRGEHGKTADLVEQYLHKGHQAFLEGHLQLDEWTGKDGTKRSKLKIVLDSVQFLERKAEGQVQPAAAAPSRQAAPAYSTPANPAPASEAPVDEDIPF